MAGDRAACVARQAVVSRGARAWARRAAGLRARVDTQASGARARADSRGVAGTRPGVLLGQRVVHSVHSACFWPGLTRYFS